MRYVYIIQSTKTNHYYIGSTPNIPTRLGQHNNDWTKSTRGKGPWILIYREEFQTKSDAIKREKEIKRYKGGNAFKKLVQQDK